MVPESALMSAVLELSLQDLSALADVVSALSIALILWQVFQTNSTVRHDSISAALKHAADRYIDNGNSDHAPRIFARTHGVRNVPCVSDEEFHEYLLDVFGSEEDRSRFYLLYLGVFSALENQFHQRKRLGKAFETPLDQRLRGHLGSPLVLRLWRQTAISNHYTDAFRAHVNRLRPEADGAEPARSKSNDADVVPTGAAARAFVGTADTTGGPS